MLLAVSLLPAPAMMTQRSPTAPMTARSSSSFSSAEVVGDSPVVPETTRPSCPESTRCVATRWAASRSIEPSGRMGVTIAERTRPRAGASAMRPRLAPGPSRSAPRPRRRASLPVTGTHEARHYSLGGPSSASPPPPSRTVYGRYSPHRCFFRQRAYAVSAAPLVGDPGEAGVLVTRRLGPVGGVDLREGDGPVRGLVDLGHEEAGGIRHRLAVDLSPADDEDLLGVGDERERVGERVRDLDAGRGPVALPGHDDAAPTGQRAHRVEGAPAHHHRVAHRRALEELQVLREVPRHGQAVADDPVAPDGDDHGHVRPGSRHGAKAPRRTRFRRLWVP